jgi:hypothetical protein
MYFRTGLNDDMSESQGVGEPIPDFRLTPPELRMPPRPRPSLLPPEQLKLRSLGPSLTQPLWRLPLFPPPHLLPTGIYPEEVIDGFTPGIATLNPAQLAKIKRFANQLVARSAPYTTAIRLVAFRAQGETDPRLGMQRAQAVQSELERHLCRLNPLITSSLRLFRNDCNVSPQGARVEIFTTVVRGVSPVSPCSTPPNEQGLPSLICPMPPRPPGRSFSQMFWQMLDSRLDSAMNSLRVPQSWHGRIRDAAHAAVDKGAEEILNRTLAAAGISGEAQEAIRASVRATVQTPIP